MTDTTNAANSSPITAGDAGNTMTESTHASDLEAFERWVTTVWRPDDGEELLKRDFPRFAFAAWKAGRNSLVWECGARKHGDLGGHGAMDCSWPECGCDPNVERVVAGLQECGWTIAKDAAPQPQGGTLTDEQIAEQPARYSIDGAIAFGRMGTNQPPAGHWLTEYWSIGQQLAELGKTSAWDNQTPVDAVDTSAPQQAGDGLTLSDYEAAFADHQRVVRELDVLLNGDAAAKQASLCDIVSQVRKEGIRSRGVALTEKQTTDLHSHMMNVAMTAWREEADAVVGSSVRSRLRAVVKALAAAPKIRADLSAAPRQPGEMGAGVQGAGMQCNCDQPTNGAHELDCPSAPRQAFETAYSHLDLTKQIDSWRGLVYKHSHVDAMWEAWQRAASAQQDEREAIAWVHEDDPMRAISAGQKAQMIRDGGASASSVKGYSVAAYRIAQQVQADAGAVAVIGSGYQLLWLGGDPFPQIVERHGIKIGTKLYAHPSPAGESDKRDAPESVPYMPANTQEAKEYVMREDFERWAKPRGYSLERTPDSYKSQGTKSAWRGWRAAMSREQSGGDRG